MSGAPLNSTNNEAFQVMFPGDSQTISFSGTSAVNSTDFNSKTRVVRLHATEDCFVVFGDSTATATSSNMFLPADQTEYFGIQSNETRIAAIQSSTGGTLYITEGKVIGG